MILSATGSRKAPKALVIFICREATVAQAGWGAAEGSGMHGAAYTLGFRPQRATNAHGQQQHAGMNSDTVNIPSH